MPAKKKIEVNDLRISFWTNQGMVRAVRGVSFDLFEQETLAIVGESGSGKSVTSRAIMGILAGNAVIDEGEIWYDGQDLTKINEELFHNIRGDRIGMIFQDPMSSLNPIMRIGKQITEGMLINGDHRKKEFKALIREHYNALYDAKVKRKSMIKEFKEQKKELKEQGDTEKITSLKEAFEKDLDAQKKAISEARKNLAKRKTEIKQEIKERYEQKAKEYDKKIETLKASMKDKIAEETPQYKNAVDQLKKEKAKRFSRIDKEHKQNMDDIERRFQSTKGTQKEKLAKEKRAEKNRYKNEKLKAKEEFADKFAQHQHPRKVYKQQLENLKEEKARIFKVTKKEAKERAIKVMEDVGIPEPDKRFRQYPFQFSGGMRQRIVIAVALTADPDVLICDEPTTALDVTIQAQILELIKTLKVDRNLSVIFITHDLGVVANMADRVAVMYAGKIVEIGGVDEIFYNPKHPYTWALLSSMPDLNTEERLQAIPGTPPNMLFPPKGDAFADRNAYAMKIDFEKEPPYFKVSDTHYAATWLLHKDAPEVELPEAVQRRIQHMAESPEGKEDES